MSSSAVAAKPRVTNESRAVIANAARAELARRSFPEFVRQAFVQLEGHEADWTPFLQGFCEFVQGMLEGWLAANGRANARQLANVMRHWAMHGLEYQPGEVLVQNANFNMPPGTMKSVIMMVCAPAWIWLHAPDFKGAFSSSNDEVVRRDSDSCRELVSSAWYIETFDITWRLKYRNAAYKKWSTTAGGSRVSRTILSGFVGLHFDGIFVDDPDEPARVFNEPDRIRVRRKWTKSIENRTMHPSRTLRIIMQQRVHAEDLSAYVRQQSAWSPTTRAGWAVFCVPMEYGRGPKEYRGPTVFGWTDPRNENGQLMTPSNRFSPAFIADEKLKKGTHGFESQYNQNPESLDGGMFQRGWFRFFTYEGNPLLPNELRPRPEGCVGHRDRTEAPAYVIPLRKEGGLDLDWITISVDATFGSVDPKKSSKVGLLVGGGKEKRRFIFEDRTKEMTYLDTLAAIRELCGKYPARMVLIEAKANGSAIIEQLERDMADAKIIGPHGKPMSVIIEPWNPGSNSKRARAVAMMTDIQAGLVFLLDGAHWLEEFLKEVCVFPNAPWDDRVDALSQLMIFYSDEYGIVLRAKAAARW